MTRHLNLLLVEDNADDTEMLLAHLRSAGYDPQGPVVATEAEYLAALDPELDVILCDYRLPGFSAAKALELLKARGNDIPFILVSGTIGEESATEMVRDGAADYLLKDRLARLGNAVSHAVQQKHQRVREKHALEEVQRLATIVESSEDAIISVTLQGKIVSWNQGAERMFGYSLAETTGSDLLMLVPSDMRDQERVNFVRLQQGYRVRPFETTRLRKDGTEVQVSVLASSIKDRSGEVTGIAVVMRDISALRAANEALRRKSLLTQMLAATAAAVNTSGSPQEALRSCLSHICAYGDWAIGHVMTFGTEGPGRPLQSLWDTADRARFERFIVYTDQVDYSTATGQFLGHVLSARQPLWVADIQTLHLVGRTATIRPLGIRCAFAMPVVVDGKVAALIEFFSEQVRPCDDLLMEVVPSLAAQLAHVIQRQRAIDALRASQEKLDGILGSLQEVVWSMDPRSGRILYVNAAVEQITRRPPAYFMAKAHRWWHLVHREDRETLQGAVRRLLRENALHHEFRIVRGDGEVRNLEARAKVLRDDKGNTARIDGTISDITDRVRAAALQQEHYALARLQALLAAAANDADTVEDALQASLDVICQQGDWQLAHMALFASGTTIKRNTSISLWCTDDSTRYAAFIDLTNHFDYTKARHIAGKVIAQKAPVWIENMHAMKSLQRHRLAVEAGLTCVFAFPVLVQDNVAALVELYAGSARPEDRFLIDNIENISTLLARVIERARAGEAHDRLAAIVESSQDAIVSSTPDGTILTWNIGAEKMFGYSEADIIGRNLTVLVPDELREEMQQRRDRYLAGTHYDPIETERLTKDKRKLPVSVNVSSIKDETGKVVGVATIYRNITERKQAEELRRKQYALAQLHAALGAAVNEATDMTAAFQSSLNLITRHGGWRAGHMAVFAEATVNNYVARNSLWQIEDNDRAHLAEFIAICEQFNYAAGKRFAGKAIVEKVPVWIEDIATAGLGPRNRVAVAAGLHCAFAFPVIVQNDVAAVLEFYSNDARPVDQLLLGNIVSITAQLGRAIERARAGEIHARLAAIVENSDDAIVGRALDGTITSWNAGAEKLFGYTSAEAVGLRTLRLTPPELQHELVRARQLIGRGMHVPAFETVRLAKDGSRLHLQITMSPTKDNSGNVTGASSICRDIGDRKKAEADLLRLNEELEEKVTVRTEALDRARNDAEEANRAKSMFLATMSHEIRTPMNGVVGMLDVLHQTSLRGDQVEMVDLIRESAFSLLGIINDILDFSKIEAGKLEIERETVSLTDVVEDVGNLLDNMAEKKQVILTQFVDPAIPAAVMGDTLRLRQVLINLINNAIKFSSGESREGRVAIRALLVELHAEQALIEFQVIDNGVGMDDETLARLFTAFTQADASTTRRFGGTGLGLVIANHLVELMGGEITVQSAPGEGATFKVRLLFDLLPDSSGKTVVESSIAGLNCVVVSNQGGLADDLARYLEHAQAVVKRAPTLEIAKQQSAGSSGVSVWIVDVGDRQPPAGQLRAAVRGQITQDVRFVCVLVERGKRRRPRVVAPDLISVDGNSLRRQTFLRAVAAAAGRASLEIDRRMSVHDAVVSAAPSRAEMLRDGRLILIAEDNETNQKVIMRQLALLGYVADVAGDGLEALERWRSENYGLLLTDLHMPKMDGYQLAQAIRKEEKAGRRIPIVALTANVLKGEADRCRAVGMDAYQSKPMPLADLKIMLDQWMPAAWAAPAVNALPDAPSHTAAQTSSRKPVDISVLEALIGDSPDIIREFLLDFDGSATQIADELRTAYAAKHTTAAVAAAHKLKSSAFSVGALALGELCAAIEIEGKSGGIDALAVLMPRFEAELAAVRNYLDNL